MSQDPKNAFEGDASTSSSNTEISESSVQVTSPASLQLDIRGGDIVERNVALLCGPVSAADQTGTGILVNATSGVVTEVLPNSVAARWGEILEGDEILAISSQPFRHGTPLLDQLVEGKRTYLCRVRRNKKQRTTLLGSIARSMCTLLPERVWTSEEQVAAAWAAADAYQRGSI